MDNSLNGKCFLCNKNCDKSKYFLGTLKTKRSKTPYPLIIGKLIKQEYELRITTSDKICQQCHQVCEKFDEFLDQANRIKAVLSKQVAATYQLETDEICDIDKTKTFIIIKFSPTKVQYKCQTCSNFLTESMTEADIHVIYHETLEKWEKPLKPTFESIYEKLNNKVDIKELEDLHRFSNLRQTNCEAENCKQNFYYMCDYVHHLKNHHNMSSIKISSIIKKKLKRPKVLPELYCPYCFTTIASAEDLAEHLKVHENVSSKSATDKLEEFIKSLCKQSKCENCGESKKYSEKKCNHKKAKSNKNAELNTYHCQVCEKCFYAKKLLNNHMVQTHKCCIKCNELFDDNLKLSDHIKSHYGSNEIECSSTCNEKVSWNNYQDHLKSKHIKHSCPHCDLHFSTSTDSNNHIRYCHINQRPERKAKICDSCGLSFREQTPYENHIKSHHQFEKKMFCSLCKQHYPYRYMLIEHMSKVHEFKIVDKDGFYKCYACSKSYPSFVRDEFIEHIEEHEITSTYCYDCHIDLRNVIAFEEHRTSIHCDYSMHVDKIDLLPELDTPENLINGNETNKINEEEEEQQQILIQTEDGSIVSVKDYMITENGEILIRNLDGMEQQQNTENPESDTVTIDNLEQYLLNHGINTEGSGYSFVQSESGEILLQHNENHSEESNLMQEYNEILDQAPIEDYEPTQRQQPQVIENVKIPQTNNSNQSTLDELGDILLEVAAAAEYKKTSSPPKMIRQIGKHKSHDNKYGSLKRTRIPEKYHEEPPEPVKNFSQAYEFFVKGFNERNKRL